MTEVEEHLEVLAKAALTPARVVQPMTGEVVDLINDPTDVLAERYREASNFVSEGARPFQRAVADALLNRMDHERTYTVRAGRWMVEGDSPNRVEVDDVDALYEELCALAASGAVSVEAVEKAFKTERKAVRSGLNALKRVPGPVAECVAAHEVQSSRPRQVKVRENRS